MTAFKTATDKTKAEAAVQMVIIDAMAKGHADKNELIAYMKSETFDNAVKGYIDLMNQPITFKNTNFTKIDYECTNIVFCQAETKPGENWIECDPAEIEKSKCKQLYIQNGVRYYGYL